MSEYEALRKSMQEKWLERFANIGAYFKHDGNVNRPHVVLGTGIHSDHFFNSQVLHVRISIDWSRLSTKILAILIGSSVFHRIPLLLQVPLPEP